MYHAHFSDDIAAYKMKNAELKMKNLGIAFGEVLEEGILNGYAN